MEIPVHIGHDVTGHGVYRKLRLCDRLYRRRGAHASRDGKTVHDCFLHSVCADVPESDDEGRTVQWFHAAGFCGG